MEDRVEAEGLATPERGASESLADVRAVSARNLRAGRTARRLRAKDLVRRTGMSRLHIAAIEAGEANATVDAMAKLAVSLETPLWKLLKP